MNHSETYRLSNHIIVITILLSFGLSWYFVWNPSAANVNLMGGDAKDYYSGLVSVFITHDFTHQAGKDWFLLKTSTGTINVHPIGVSLLLLPFFAIACLFAFVFHLPVDGYSLPFQISTAVAAMFYAVIGLIYLKKLFQLHQIGDVVSAIILLLVFFGTNLLNYTIVEAGMSHVYSFGLISAFLYHSSSFVLEKKNRNLIDAFLIFGLILLVRPNNVFILLTVFIWFKSLKECKLFFAGLFRNKVFYLSVVLATAIVLMQSLVWFIQSNSLFHNTYKADGFYWLNPHVFNMLFGFDGGFFIYTPLCFLFLLGLFFMFRENKFSAIAAVLFLAILFYFFGSYWAYTYFDGLGIRVLVDYYALFSFIGAKFFVHLLDKHLAYNLATLVASFFMFVNLIYCYQSNRGILLRAGMTYNKWKYVFMRTGPEFQNCLGGSNELTPYSKEEQKVVASKKVDFESPFDYSQKDYGVTVAFDSINFSSNRIRLKIEVARKELFANASKDAIICMSLEDKNSHTCKAFEQFKLNETPSVDCCEKKEYSYTTNMNANFQPGDKLGVLLLNVEKQPFWVDKFSVEIYNYNFKIN